MMYEKIYETLDRNGRIKTALILTGAHKGSRCIVENGCCITSGKTDMDWKPYQTEIAGYGETGVITVNSEDVFVEIYVKNPRLVILGGGHVSQPVAQIGKILGFHVTVMDDRAEFVTRERFPDADRLVTGSFSEIDTKIPVYENTYYVTVTRGHMGDCMCARQILKRPFAYFGMIGSRNKVKLTREKLLEEGFLAEQLDSIHAPIGLPIGGQMPEEIAVSIMAEIIQEKNKFCLSYTDEKVEEAVKAKKSGVMMTIISKRGSSPRGTGSKMFLDGEGKSFGSIGGGNVEFMALQHAPSVTETEVVKYNLSNEGQASLGMICGGEVEVLFEKI